LGLPHALVELARLEESWGAMICDFTHAGRKGLVHGNELLTELEPHYPVAQRYRVGPHTLNAVHAGSGRHSSGRRHHRRCRALSRHSMCSLVI
jgi:hypothetical protein